MEANMRMMPRLKVTEQISVRSEEKRRMYLRATPPSSIRQFMDFLSIVASTTLAMLHINAVAVMMPYALFCFLFSGRSRASGTADSKENVRIVSRELTTLRAESSSSTLSPTSPGFMPSSRSMGKHRDAFSIRSISFNRVALLLLSPWASFAFFSISPSVSSSSALSCTAAVPLGPPSEVPLLTSCTLMWSTPASSEPSISPSFRSPPPLAAKAMSSILDTAPAPVLDESFCSLTLNFWSRRSCHLIPSVPSGISSVRSSFHVMRFPFTVRADVCD
mmetsp:Transcript_1918/g.4359  ORF Transcript_1918/g.4359 Transcript_1918/m.4359 type:complete len:276 (+) Transcript_1918:1334-2161(+)